MKLLTFTVSAVALIAAPCFAGPTFSFTRIVQTGDLIPGSSETFTNLSRPGASNGNFAWQGSGSTIAGIYSLINGVPGVVAQSGMSIPSTGGTFSAGSFTNALGKIDGSDVAFRAGNGIYASFGGGSLVRVADSTMTNPGNGGSFTQFQQPYISNGVVTFTNGAIGNTTTVTKYESGSLSNVWNSSTAMPSPMVGNFFGAGQAVSSDGTIAAQAFDSGFKQAILTNRGGSLSVVANGYDNIPGQSFSFVQFLDPDVQNDNIAFIGWGPGGTGPGGVGNYKGIFEDNGGGLNLVVDTNTLSPATGTVFRDFTRGPSIFGDSMLFVASIYSGASLDSIYIRSNGQVSRIIDITQTLDGKTPISFDLHQESMYSPTDGSFLATFSDGSKGIYSFSIPAPGSIALLAIGLIAGRGRKRAI